MERHERVERETLDQMTQMIRRTLFDSRDYNLKTVKGWLDLLTQDHSMPEEDDRLTYPLAKKLHQLTKDNHIFAIELCENLVINDCWDKEELRAFWGETLRYTGEFRPEFNLKPGELVTNYPQHILSTRNIPVTIVDRAFSNLRGRNPRMYLASVRAIYTQLNEDRTIRHSHPLTAHFSQFPQGCDYYFMPRLVQKDGLALSMVTFVGNVAERRVDYLDPELDFPNVEQSLNAIVRVMNHYNIGITSHDRDCWVAGESIPGPLTRSNESIPCNFQFIGYRILKGKTFKNWPVPIVAPLARPHTLSSTFISWRFDVINHGQSMLQPLVDLFVVNRSPRPLWNLSNRTPLFLSDYLSQEESIYPSTIRYIPVGAEERKKFPTHPFIHFLLDHRQFHHGNEPFNLEDIKKLRDTYYTNEHTRSALYSYLSSLDEDRRQEVIKLFPPLPDHLTGITKYFYAKWKYNGPAAFEKWASLSHEVTDAWVDLAKEDFNKTDGYIYRIKAMEIEEMDCLNTLYRTRL